MYFLSCVEIKTIIIIIIISSLPSFLNRIYFKYLCYNILKFTPQNLIFAKEDLFFKLGKMPLRIST